MTGLRGRPAKPAAIKKLEGNKSRRPIPKEPDYKEQHKCKPPAWLDDVGAKKYKELFALMSPVGVLTEADDHALAMCAAAFADFIAASEAIKQFGRVYATVTQTGSEVIRPRPEVAQMQDAWRRHLGALAHFGLTPATRSRVGSGDKKDEGDEFTEFLRSRSRG